MAERIRAIEKRESLAACTILKDSGRKRGLAATLLLFLAILSGCAGTPQGSGGTGGVVEITTASSLGAGTIGIAYNVQLVATGGKTPYHWALNSGSSLPAGVSLSAAGVLSGIPIAAGTATFDITVIDSASPASSATQNFSLTINAALTGQSLLQGNYAFLLRGFNSTGAIAVAGSFVADGAGNITGGVQDFNSIGGSPKRQTFNGTYTIGANGLGALIFSGLSGSPTYALALNSTGTYARIIEQDASGNRGSGELARQTIATCSANRIAGSASTGEMYVVGLSGAEAAFSGNTSAGPLAVAGAFQTYAPAGVGQAGSLTGEADVNLPNYAIPTPPSTSGLPLSGSFNAGAQPAFCTMTLSPQQTSAALTFDVYPVAGTSSDLNSAFVIETDTVSAATPYLASGRLVQQCIVSGNSCETAPFNGQTAGTFFTANSIGALTGQYLNTQISPNAYVPDVAAAELAGSGGQTFNMSIVENQGGTVSTFGSPFQGTFNLLDSFGRASTSIASPIAPVFYVISANTALCIGQIDNNPIIGYFQPQSGGPFSPAKLRGAFIEGTASTGTAAAPDYAGVVALDGISTVSGTQDVSTAAGNTASETLAGSYATTNSSTGSGIYQLTAPGVFTGSFFILSSTQFVIVSTTPGDANPVLIIAGY